ncbi:hypothetical protein [Pseudonocardia sp. TRM90224]|uniref:hypothetical protein n=1 Tax=Pseudonocardia sp. TRM90224 TaxID=2812678 RepID=UPI001E34C178|nr:hypothetical protein [Pseudonocardia sp. TRM90224]
MTTTDPFHDVDPTVVLGTLQVQVGSRCGSATSVSVPTSTMVEFPAVAIAAIVNPTDEVLLLWWYRMPIDRCGYELLGGLVDLAEDPVR